jgi:hypothetical protein
MTQASAHLNKAGLPASAHLTSVRWFDDRA